MELKLSKDNMKASGKDRMLTAPVITRNSRVMLPLTDIQRALKDLHLDVEVKWEHKSKTVRN